MKSIKRLAIATLGIILLVITALVIFIQFVDINPYKSKITHLIDTKTGYRSEIGSIELSLFPSPALALTQVEINNPSLPQDKTLFYAKNARIKLSLNQLLSGHLSFDEISIDKLITRYTINKQGISNWQVINKSSSSKQTKIKHAGKSDKTQNPAQLPNFKHITINNAIIDYANASNNQTLHVNNTNFDLKRQAQLINYKLKTTLNYNQNKHKIQGTIHSDGSIDLTKLFNPTANKGIAVNGHFGGNPLIINHFKIDSIHGNFAASKNQLNVNNAIAKLYDGTATTKLQVKQHGQFIAVSEKIDGIDLHQLLKDTIGVNLIDGSVNLKLDAKASGFDTDKIKQSASGQASFSIQKGLIRSLNLPALISQISTTVKQFKHNPLTNLTSYFKSHPATANENGSKSGTEFSVMSGQIHFENGKLIFDNIAMNSERYRLTGEGSINLLNQDIDYNLQVTDLKPSTTIKQAQGLLGGSFPISIAGKLNRPKPMPDMLTIARQASKNLVKTNYNSLSQSGKNLADKLKNSLRF